MDLWEKQGMCHPSQKYPWMILVLAICQGPASIAINGYQAPGGADVKNIVVGVFLQWWMMASFPFGFLLIPLLWGLILWAVGVWHGYAVFQKSK